jgi:hypothetical protein
VPFSKIFPSSRALNLLKKGFESPGKVLEFHEAFLLLALPTHWHRRISRVIYYFPEEVMKVEFCTELWIMYP